MISPSRQLNGQPVCNPCLLRVSSPTRSTGCSGFTLLEVLISLLLLSLLSLISWRALDGVQRGTERLDMALDESQAIARVLGQLADDINAHAGVDVLPPKSALSRAQQKNALLSPGMHIAQEHKGETALAIVRSAPTKEGGWQRVVWQQEGSTLQRAAGQPDIALPLPVPNASTTVLDNISDFTLRLWLPGSGWLNLADTARLSAKEMRPATGLEISITMPARGQYAVYRKVVPIRTRG